MDSKAPSLTVMCEVCGAYFETRRGLSSHARLHLRQLGVTLSETSGAPIDLLYQIVQERDGPFHGSSSTPLIAPVPTSNKNTQEGPGTPKGSTSKSKGFSKHGNKVRTTGLSVSPSVHKGSASSLSAEDSRLSGASTSTTSGKLAMTKPLWAPQESDAPLTLAMNSNDEVHVCQLCGAWYETRKGLASHARAHLRQFGVTENTETKGGPIEFLYHMMDAEDLQPISGEQEEPMNLYTPSKSSLKRQLSLSPSPKLARGSPSPLQSPASKQAKPSDEFVCILCGEEFENRKGLASHSRSHLRGFGITDLMGKASAIATVHQLVDSGVLAAVLPLKTDNNNKALCSDPAPPLSPPPALSASKAPATAVVPARSTQSPLIPPSKAPKAKKGFRLAVDPLNRKPKPEPLETEVSSPLSNSSPSTRWSNPDGVAKSLSAEIESIPLIPCDFCGQFFDSRKALSCHARAHLRQLGITWSLNEPPIETLRDVMLRGGEIKKEPSSAGAKSAWGQPTWAPRGPKNSLDNLSLGTTSPKIFAPPLDFSLKGKPAQGKSEAVSATCCELCGFDFDNRKALASHARAHLRQLGVTEWRVKGSPIELLKECIQKEPEKVAEITRRYREGDLHIKKRSVPSPSPVLDSDFIPSGSHNPPGLHLGRRAGREVAGATRGHSSRAPSVRSQAERGNGIQHALPHTRTAHSDLILRSPRGFERRLPKHPVPREGGEGETDSQMPSRSGNIPAMLPKPPLTPLVKLVGKIYSLKCRFCEEVFCGPLSIQEDWIRHLQEHIGTLGYSKSPVSTPVLVSPLAV